MGQGSALFHESAQLAPLSYADHSARIFGDVQIDCEQTWMVILQADENAAAAACRGGTLQNLVTLQGRVMNLYGLFSR